MMAAARVGVKMRRAFVSTAREEAAADGERFTGAFLLIAFAEAVTGMCQALVTAGMAGGAEDWREALAEVVQGGSQV